MINKGYLTCERNKKSDNLILEELKKYNRPLKRQICEV